MNAKELRGLILENKKELQSIEGIQNIEFKTYKSLSATKIKGLEKKYSVQLPEFLKVYYQTSNGHKISWRKESPVNDLIGRSEVRSLEPLLKGGITTYVNGRLASGIPFYPSDLPEKQKEELQKFSVFEQIYLNRFILINPRTWHEEELIYLYEPPFSIHKLDLNFEQYFYNLFKYFAILNWQQKFIKEEQITKKYSSQLDNDIKLLNKDSKNFSIGSVKKYGSRLDSLIEKLESSPIIKKVKLQKYPKLHPTQISLIEKKTGLELPSDMQDFFSEINGFKLIWHTNLPADKAFFGKIDIQPLPTIFGGTYAEDTLEWNEFATKGLLWDDSLKEDEAELFEQIKPLKVFDRHLERNQVLFQLEKETLKFYYWVDRELRPMNISFQELIEGIFATGGIEYYPALLMSDNKVSKEKEAIENKIQLINLKS